MSYGFRKKVATNGIPSTTANILEGTPGRYTKRKEPPKLPSYNRSSFDQGSPATSSTKTFFSPKAFTRRPKKNTSLDRSQSNPLARRSASSLSHLHENRCDGEGPDAIDAHTQNYPSDLKDYSAYDRQFEQMLTEFNQSMLVQQRADDLYDTANQQQQMPIYYTGANTASSTGRHGTFGSAISLPANLLHYAGALGCSGASSRNPINSTLHYGTMQTGGYATNAPFYYTDPAPTLGSTGMTADVSCVQRPPSMNSSSINFAPTSMVNNRYMTDKLASNGQHQLQSDLIMSDQEQMTFREQRNIRVATAKRAQSALQMTQSPYRHPIVTTNTSLQNIYNQEKRETGRPRDASQRLGYSESFNKNLESNNLFQELQFVVERDVPDWLWEYSKADSRFDPLLKWDLFQLPQLDDYSDLLMKLFKRDVVQMVVAFEKFRYALIAEIERKKCEQRVADGGRRETTMAGDGDYRTSVSPEEAFVSTHGGRSVVTVNTNVAAPTSSLSSVNMSDSPTTVAAERRRWSIPRYDDSLNM